MTRVCNFFKSLTKSYTFIFSNKKSNKKIYSINDKNYKLVIAKLKDTSLKSLYIQKTIWLS